MKKESLLEIAKITNELKNKELNVENYKQTNVENSIKNNNRMNARNNYTIILSILLIGMIIITFIIMTQRQRINVDCTMSGIDYNTELYTDASFNTQTLNLQNSTITCKGNIDISNLALMIGG
jgi:K+-transporting ATPase A subunit